MWRLMAGAQPMGVGADDSASLAQPESTDDRFRIGFDDPKQRRGWAGGSTAALLVLLHRVEREAEAPSELRLA